MQAVAGCDSVASTDACSSWHFRHFNSRKILPVPLVAASPRQGEAESKYVSFKCLCKTSCMQCDTYMRNAMATTDYRVPLLPYLSIYLHAKS